MGCFSQVFRMGFFQACQIIKAVQFFLLQPRDSVQVFRPEETDDFLFYRAFLRDPRIDRRTYQPIVFVQQYKGHSHSINCNGINGRGEQGSFPKNIPDSLNHGCKIPTQAAVRGNGPGREGSERFCHKTMVPIYA